MSENTGSLRGRTYKCARCLYVGEKLLLMNHIITTHCPSEQVPYFCNLCGFKALNEKGIKKHASTFKAHTEKVKRFASMGVRLNLQSYIKISENPYAIKEGEDFERLSREKSQEVWKSKSRGRASQQATPPEKSTTSAEPDIIEAALGSPINFDSLIVDEHEEAEEFVNRILCEEEENNESQVLEDTRIVENTSTENNSELMINKMYNEISSIKNNELPAIRTEINNIRLFVETSLSKFEKQLTAITDTVVSAAKVIVSERSKPTVSHEACQTDKCSETESVGSEKLRIVLKENKCKTPKRKSDSVGPSDKKKKLKKKKFSAGPATSWKELFAEPLKLKSSSSAVKKDQLVHFH